MACTPDNVIAQVLNQRDYAGKALPFEAVEDLDNLGKKTFYEAQTRVNAETAQEAGLVPDAVKALAGDLPEVGGVVITDMRNPSGILGEDTIKPVVEFITDHFDQHFDDIAAGRSDYMSGIRDVLDDINEEALTDHQRAYLRKYKNFYMNGGELYNLNERSGLEKGVSNLTGNVIKSSPNVLIGNILEGTIKLPTMYPTTFLQAIGEANKHGGVHTKIPELERQGVYGLNYAGEDAGKWEGLIGLTDVPLKNIAYYADKLAGGDGVRGVQRVAFTPRFGDLPSIYYSGGGRGAIGLLGYTINSYKMYGSLLKEASKGNVGPLVTYHVLTGLLGGGVAAGLPQPLEDAIKMAFPDAEDWFKENQNNMAQLFKPGNITRLGVTYDIAKRQAENTGKSMQKGIEALQDGDLGTAALDLAESGLGALAFSNHPIGDLNIQKAMKIGRDVMTGETDAEDVPQEVLDTYVPKLGIEL